jgi:steroid delta-isomerase-like uncharacterized protein
LNFAFGAFCGVRLALGPSEWHHSKRQATRGESAPANKRRKRSVSTEENKRLAREAIGIWTTGDLAAADEIYAPDYVNHQHHDPDDPRDLHGVEAMKRFAREFREAFPDFRDSVDIQIAEGNMVATRFTSRGTQKGLFMGVEPTNKKLVWTGITIDRIADGKIVESWANWDMMGLMQQLDAVSAPE